MKKSYQSVTTDVVIFTIEDNQLKVLLVKRRQPPFKNCWALPGGFILPNESPTQSAQRVLQDKASTNRVYIEQLYTFADPQRDSRGNVITITYFALTPSNKIKLRSSTSTPTSALLALKQLPSLAFDHRKIIDYALKRLQAKLEYTNIVYSLLPRHFTLSQLQQTYQTILDHLLDKRNFRKKFLQLGLIRLVPKVYKGARQRPAQLYQFTSTRPAELKKFF